MSAKFLWLLRDFVPEYHHTKFGCNWTTKKWETEGGGGHNVPPSLYGSKKTPAWIGLRCFGLLSFTSAHELQLLMECSQEIPLLKEYNVSLSKDICQRWSKFNLPRLRSEQPYFTLCSQNLEFNKALSTLETEAWNRGLRRTFKPIRSTVS